MSTTTRKYGRHGASLAFRDHSEEEAEALKESMRTGFDPAKPIIATGGLIIAGWHRYQAALAAGVEPVIKDHDDPCLTPGEIFTIVRGDELARRHMTPGERAEALVNLQRACGMEFAGAGRPEKGSPDPFITRRSVAEAAQVSTKTAARAINRVKGIVPTVADPGPTVDPSATIADLEAQLFRATEKVRDLEEEGRNIIEAVESEDTRKLMMKYTSQGELVRSLKASVGEWQMKHSQVLRENQSIRRKIKALEKAKAA